MMGRNITIKTEEILYLLFFGLLFWAKGIGLYDGQPLFKVFLIAAVLCLVGKLCIGVYTVQESIIMAGILLMGGVCYLTSGDKGLLLYCFMIVGMKNVDIKRCSKVALIVWSIAFVGLWLVSLTHMSDTMYRVANKLGMEHIFRWSMGYAHPNVLHITYLLFAVLILIIAGNRISWKHYIGLTIGNLLVFLYSVSYTGVMIVFMLIAGRVYLQLRTKGGKRLNILERGLLASVFPVCLFISLAAPIFLEGKAFEILDKLLNTRLTLARYYLRPEYLSWFGRRLSEITTTHLTMDNSYVYALIIYGVLPFVLISIACVIMILKLLKKECNVEVLCVSVLFVAGLTEPFLFNTSFKNISFLLMGSLLFEAMEQKQGKTVSLSPKMNKEYCFLVDRQLQKWYDGKRHIDAHKIPIIVGAIIGAVVAVIIYQGIVPKPEGYVVRRSNCEGISEEIILFGEHDSDYAGFYYMDDFEQGDEIEYFTGDIVLMENIRGSVMSLLIGGIIGGVFVVIGLYLRRNVS
ncbi:MAG: hypothetical protein PUC12_14650 [Clostridiales bacterium]|nr:hypothetical protein [Clostridiales bacterium]